MKAVLICPDRRAEVALLARQQPLALVPILGASLLAHWLTHLADRGAKQVTLLATDRPDQVRTAVGRGERWGLEIEMVAEARESSAAEAQARYEGAGIVLADRLPGLPALPLFETYAGFFAALLAGLLTSPLVLVAAMRNRGSGHLLFARRGAAVPTGVAANTAWRELEYAELNGFTGLARRWPQLWRIVGGEFTWVGNRPLTREQAGQLATEFEQLWLAAPIGLVSLADTFGCAARFDDEARVHSSFYAVRADGRLDRTILRWLLLRSSPQPPMPVKSPTTHENRKP